MRGYIPNYLPEAHSVQLLSALSDREGLWQEETISMFGKRIQVPRTVAWCGDPDVVYRYSGTDHQAEGWLPELVPLRNLIEDRFGLAANFALLNRYCGGSEHMGWHRDDEGASSEIVSISLGATRRFSVRSAPGDVQRYDLEHGSALHFDGAQQHRLHPTAKAVGTRINVTFRQV